MTRQELVAYAAGFFDGEGHIRIQKHSRRGSWMLQITAVQATKAPLPLFIELFGGTLSERLKPYRGVLKRLWTWQASSRQAENVLLEMQPYLIDKADEVLLAFEFRSTFRPQYGERSKNPPELEERRKALMIDMQEVRKAKRLVAV